MIDLARVAWGHDNPTFRQVFTSRFIPGGTPEQLQWFNDLCLKTTSGEVVAKLLESRATVDISGSLGEVRTPTLVCTRATTKSFPSPKAVLLASAIPGAEFVELDSRNHVLLEHEPAWQRFQDAVLVVPANVGAGSARRVRLAVSPRAAGAVADDRRVEQR